MFSLKHKKYMKIIIIKPYAKQNYENPNCV